jgi:hypothetical protein
MKSIDRSVEILDAIRTGVQMQAATFCLAAELRKERTALASAALRG